MIALLKPAVMAALVFQAITDAIDLPSLVDLVVRLGVTGLLVVWLWMMLTDRLHTPQRVQDALTRTEKAEIQRDEAMKLASELRESVDQMAEAQKATLDWIRSTLSGRSG